MTGSRHYLLMSVDDTISSELGNGFLRFRFWHVCCCPSQCSPKQTLQGIGALLQKLRWWTRVRKGYNFFDCPTWKHCTFKGRNRWTQTLIIFLHANQRTKIHLNVCSFWWCSICISPQSLSGDVSYLGHQKIDDSNLNMWAETSHTVWPLFTLNSSDEFHGLQ